MKLKLHQTIRKLLTDLSMQSPRVQLTVLHWVNHHTEYPINKHLTHISRPLCEIRYLYCTNTVPF